MQALAILFIFWGFFLFSDLYPESPRNLRVGGSTQVMQARYVDQKNSQKSSLWAEWEWNGLSLLGEERGEKSLSGAKYQNDYYAIALGHRYKTIPGFYLGRDPNFYSTLTKDQPIQRSGFLNFLPGYLSPGVFALENHTGKKAGFSLILPDEIFAFTYSPDTRLRTFYANLYKVRLLPRSFPKTYFWLNGEGIGTKLDYYGYLSSKLEIEDRRFYWEGRTYKDNDGILFQSIDPGIEIRQKPIVSWTAVGSGNYHKMELFDSVEPALRKQYQGFQLGLWDLGWGSPVVRYREYISSKEDGIQKESNMTKAHALLWIGTGKKFNYYLGREIRENKDLLTEAGLSFYNYGYRLEAGAIFQKENNIFFSPVENLSTTDITQVSVTDKKTVIRLRLKTKFLDWNITASDRMGRKGSFIFMNLQFLLEF
jgi:hypothetical protein